MATWIDQIYADVAKAATTNLVGYFRPNQAQADEQQRQFMAGQIRNPIFVYYGVSGKHFGPKLDRLDDHLEPGSEFMGLAASSELGQLWIRALERRRNSLRLARACQQSDMVAFAQANWAMGLMPREDIYNSILRSLERRFANDPEGPGQELLELLPSSNFKSLLPSERIMRDVQDRVMGICDELHLPTRYRLRGMWDAQYFVDMFNRSLTSSRAGEWKAEVTDKQRRMSTSSTKKRIFVPVDRKIPAFMGLAIMAHERLHVERYWRGEQSGFYLLYGGTAGNPWAEEGVTTVLEESIIGNIRLHTREDYYLAASLAAGMIDSEVRDFRAVYEVMVTYYRARDTEVMPSNRSSESPEERAWIMAMRIFRGTDCKTPGVFFGKDTIYTTGNLNIWQLLERSPASVQYFTAGKFNPADDDEVNALVAAGVIPALN
ncbi:MAG: hypothetical protein QG658_293 [Patescibacteria group bacterium]|nr:hypothetical protein [Patescibacteria group bacterium]